MQHFKRWHGVVIAMSTALAIVLASGTAHASLPLEDTKWNTEEIGPNHDVVRTGDTYHEARQSNGIHTAIWRGDGDNGIWASYNNGPAYQISPGAHTFVAPTIVAWADGWAAFHTGADHRIYWTTSTNTPTGPGEWGEWSPIAGHTTAQSVSVTQPGPGSHNLLMAYRGDIRPGSDDQRLFWSWFSGTQWDAARTMGDNARSPSAPAVAWARSTDPNHDSLGTVYATHQGQNGEIFFATLVVGTTSWSNWNGMGGTTHTSPQVAVNSENYIVYSHRADDGQIWDGVMVPTGIGGAFQGWERETTGLRTDVSAALVTLGIFVYLLLTDRNHVVQYKRVFSPPF